MKKLSTAFLYLFVSIFVFPTSAFATGASDLKSGLGTFSGIIDTLTETVIKSLATLLLALALLAFFWGIVQYIWSKRNGDGKGVMDGNKFMQAGLIALFVMFSVYGIIKFVQNTLAPGTDWSRIIVPSFNFGGGASNTDTNAGINSPGQTGISDCTSLKEGLSCKGGAGTCRNSVCITNAGNSSSLGCPAGQTMDSAGDCVSVSSGSSSGLPRGSRCTGVDGEQGPCANDLTCVGDPGNMTCVGD